jgi:acetoacetyl-CoA synthetase
VIGDILWRPPADLRESTQAGQFMTFVEQTRGQSFPNDYDDLLTWSLDDLEGFWQAVAEFFELKFHTPYTRVLSDRRMPGAKWFDGATLNYAEHMLGRPEDGEQVAVVARSQTRPEIELTFGQLKDQVARARAGLQRLGVAKGDRVVAYMPNIPETLVAYLATISLGAIWATCAPEFGPRSVIDRFGQIEPKILFTIPGYGFRDRYIDRGEEVRAIRAGLPTVEHVITVPYGEGTLPDDAVTWDELLHDHEPLQFEPVPFDHPIYVLFSSGTTGLPKAIVHGHGGQLIEHVVNQGLIWDLKRGGRIQWFSTTAWMMWNALVSCLLLGSSIVMLDGDPTWPDLLEQWRIAEQLQPTLMGVSPVYLMACRKAGHYPGSPLPSEGYHYVYESLGPDVCLINGSGGTDTCCGLVGGSRAQPVYDGELAGRYPGIDTRALDPDGNEIIGELGEMVVMQPMPSMPVALWGDRDGRRYRDAYFDHYPGIWRQGDWIKFTERGTCIITGRSDATLNRGGVRLGTSEFYSVIEELPEVVDALVVHLEDSGGGSGELLLFVVVAAGATGADTASAIDDGLQRKIAVALRSQLSPRHIPDRIVPVAAIPRTLTGKKLEAPVKRLLRGEPAEKVASRGSLLDATALDAFIEFARTRTPA